MKMSAEPAKSSLKAKAEAHNQSPAALLQKELKQLIKDVDEEGLKFLVKQAKTLIHNQTVKAAAVKAAKTAGPKAEPKASFKMPEVLDLEGEINGTTFFLVTAKSRSILSRTEVSALVKAAYSSTQVPECLNALFNYLSRERQDILSNAGATAKAHSFFESLYKIIRSKFKPKA